MPIFWLAAKVIGMLMWSCRSLPTPGKSCTGSTSASRNSSAGPMPDRSSSWHDPIAPAVSTTSDPACATSSRALVEKFDADGPALLDDDPGDGHAGPHGEVGALQRRPQIGFGGAPALAVPDGELEEADAFLVGAVEIVVVPVAGRLGSLEPHPLAGVEIGGIADMQRPSGAVQGVVAEALVVLAHLEHRQHVGPGPARTPPGGPAVVVGGQAPHVDHGVERARAAHHPAAWPEDSAPPAAGLRHGVETPVRPRVEHRDPVGRDVGGERGGPPGFEHQHPARRIGAEAVGHHAAGRPGADDDRVIHAKRLLSGGGGEAGVQRRWDGTAVS